LTNWSGLQHIDSWKWL